MRLRGRQICATPMRFEAIEDPEVTTLNLDGEIRDGRHHMQIRVYYEDTDFSVWPSSAPRCPSAARISAFVRLAGKTSMPMIAESRP